MAPQTLLIRRPGPRSRCPHQEQRRDAGRRAPAACQFYHRRQARHPPANPPRARNGLSRRRQMSSAWFFRPEWPLAGGFRHSAHSGNLFTAATTARQLDVSTRTPPTQGNAVMLVTGAPRIHANFLPKFDNQAESARLTRDPATAGARCLAVTKKHSGHLVMCPPSIQRTGAPTGTLAQASCCCALTSMQSFRDVAASASTRGGHAEAHGLCYSFECIVPRVLGDHGATPRAAYMVLTVVSHVGSGGTFLSPAQLLVHALRGACRSTRSRTCRGPPRRRWRRRYIRRVGRQRTPTRRRTWPLRARCSRASCLTAKHRVTCSRALCSWRSMSASPTCSRSSRGTRRRWQRRGRRR